MPMLHAVLFHFDAAKLADEFKAGEIKDCLDSLKTDIPGVLEINFSEKDSAPWNGYVDCSKGYTHLLVSKHVDEIALKTYAEDAVHLKLGARFKKCSVEPPLRVDIKI